MPYKLPVGLAKRFAVLAYLQEFAYINPRDTMRELHRQGVDVSMVIINDTLRRNGWIFVKLDNSGVMWLNPDVPLPCDSEDGTI